MFLLNFRRIKGKKGFLRVSGGVSIITTMILLVVVLSPRERRCFLYLLKSHGVPGAFSA